MFLNFGLIFQALLLAGAVWLVITMARRFPSDWESLSRKYRDYRTRNDPQVLEGMRSEARQRNYRETSVLEFRSEAIVMGLLWGLTILAGLYALVAIIGIILRIASAFRA